jgi:hypothetical protein
MNGDRVALAQLIGFYVAAALTWAWIEVSCVISILMGFVKWGWRNASALSDRPRSAYSPFEEGIPSTIFFAGLVGASYFIPDRAVEFAIAAFQAAQNHTRLIYEPTISNIQRSTQVAAMFWFFGAGWVGKVMPLDVPWGLVTVVWLMLTAAAGYGAAVLFLAAS